MGRTSSHARGQPMFTCTSLDLWHSPEADNYQGLRVARSIDPLYWQSLADQLSTMLPPDDCVHEQRISLDAP